MCVYAPPQVDVQVFQWHLLERLSPPPTQDCFRTSLRNQLSTNVRVDSWIVFILSTCKSLFTPGPWGWRLCSTLCNQEGWVLQHRSCFSRVFLAFLGSLNIHENDEITLSLSAEKICVKSVGQLGNITCHSTTWSFPVYDDELPPSFLDFFKQCFIVFKGVRFTLSWLISL